MKEIIFGTLCLLVLSGCASDSARDDSGSSAAAPSTTNVYSNGDATYTQVTQAEGATFITTESGDVINVAGDYYGDLNTDSRSGAFNANYNESECVAEGYFWCSLSGKCINQYTTTGSCTYSVDQNDVI